MEYSRASWVREHNRISRKKKKKQNQKAQKVPIFQVFEYVSKIKKKKFIENFNCSEATCTTQIVVQGDGSVNN